MYYILIFIYIKQIFFSYSYLDSKLKKFFQYFNQLSNITFLTNKYISESSRENLIYLFDFVSLTLKLDLITVEKESK